MPIGSLDSKLPGEFVKEERKWLFGPKKKNTGVL
jgi:hypothetical protein